MSSTLPNPLPSDTEIGQIVELVQEWDYLKRHELINELMELDDK
jgi:hypothetical protein